MSPVFTRKRVSSNFSTKQKPGVPLTMMFLLKLCLSPFEHKEITGGRFCGITWRWSSSIYPQLQPLFLSNIAIWINDLRKFSSFLRFTSVRDCITCPATTAILRQSCMWNLTYHCCFVCMCCSFFCLLCMVFEILAVKSALFRKSSRCKFLCPHIKLLLFFLSPFNCRFHMLP